MNLREILNLDTRFSARFRIAEKPGGLRTAAKIFAHSGDSWFWGVGLLILWLLRDSYWGQRALFLGISVIITAVIVLLIKFTIRRKRPEGEWGEIYRSTDPHSFPSGHATRAFMLAAIVIGLGPPWFAILLVLWAPLVSIARVAMGVHYISDVVAGAFLGILIGWINYHVVPTMINSLNNLL